MKTLLIGPAGSGKTHRLLDEFEETLRTSENLLDDSFYFVLPSAEHTERIISLTLQRGIKGFFKSRVTTLNSLLNESFAIPSEGVATNVTRFLLIRNVVESRDWPYFKDVQQTPGFLNLLLTFITELKESRISKEIFREKMNAMKSVERELSAKYEALAGIYEAYEDALAQKGLRDRQDSFDLYRARKKGSGTVRFRKIWLDGFFDFSELQLAYLKELADHTEEMTLTLTIDPDPARHELFEAVQKTQVSLEKIGFEVQPMERRGDTRSAPVTLRHIEHNLFSADKLKTKPKADGLIKILEAVGIEGEVEMIAREILRLMRDESFRLSDIAILLRTVSDYESVIRSVFMRYDIPVEIHERGRLKFAPLIQVVVTLLKIYLDGWQRNDLMDFLKSKYVRTLDGSPKKMDWVRRLEHESIRRRLYKGRDGWLELDPTLGELAALEDGLRGAKTVNSVKGTLQRAIERIFQPNLMTSTHESFLKRDHVSFKRFEALLEEVERSYPAANKAEGLFESFCERFFRLVDLDLYSTRNANKNQVQVYTVSLARQKEYKVVFVAGMLEKKFPMQMREDPVLGDWERELFNNAVIPEFRGRHSERSEESRGKVGGIDPSKTTSSQDDGVGVLQERLARQSMERYLFYLAVTRAKEQLILTYPCLDLEGKQYLPSFYLEEVKDLFASGALPIEKQNLSRPYPHLHDAVNARELELALMGAHWVAEKDGVNPEPLLLMLTNHFMQDEARRFKVERAFHRVEDALDDPEIAKKNPFGAKLTSPSKLESYGKCPFSYFADKVLNLNDPDEDPNITQRGKILHRVMELCLPKWLGREKGTGFRIKGKQNLSPTDIAKANQEAQKILTEVLEEMPILSDRQYRYDLEIADLRETLQYFLQVELEQILASPFQPAQYEYPFGMFGKDPLELKFADRTVKIRGVIDRIDVDEKNGLAMVLDYKRKTEFKKEKLELGTALQLPIYSKVVEEHFPFKVVAAELYSMKDRKRNGFYREEAKAVYPKKRKTSFMSDAEYAVLIERSMEFIERFTADMNNMIMQAKPRDRDHCEMFCQYGPVCRIQKWKLPMMMEELKNEDDSPVIASPASQG